MTRAALVGLGGIAEEHLNKLARIEGAEVVGVCDLSEVLVEAVTERFGVGPGFTDHRRMLAEVKPEVVHVLTPPQTHRRLVLDTLEAGAHAIVEKPIALGFQEYAEMRDAAAARGLLINENYNYRFMPAVTRALELARSGAVGDPVNFDVTLGVPILAPGGSYMDRDLPHFGHELPGGALHNFVSHPASFVAAFLGPPAGVAVSRRRLTPGFPGDDELRALVRTDTATAVLTLTTHVTRFGLTLALQGTSGTIEVDVIEGRVHLDAGASALARITGGVRRGAGQVVSSAGVVTRTLTARHDYYEGIEHLLRAFYVAVRGEGDPPVPVAEMDATNLLVDAVLDPRNAV
jgi:predicted dehydrogenase